MSHFSRPTEQQVLRLSTYATVTLAILGIAFGLLAHSQSIVFDGIFSVIDAIMSFIVLFVSGLLLHPGSRRFQYGYWHFEPLVSAFRGFVLLAICIYALINGIRDIIGGGDEVEFGIAAVYSFVVLLACIFIYVYERRVNRRLRSEFIRIDMNSYLMSIAITFALLLGFISAEVLEYFGYRQFKPYADPTILIVIACCLIPIPVNIVRNSLKEVFMLAPREATQKVNAVMKGVMQRHQFEDFRAYVAKSGRIHTIDITILVSPRYDKTVVEIDEIRNEIARELHEFARLEQWLTISLTAHREWL